MQSLEALIGGRRDERGWTFQDLADRSGGKPTRQRWQQLASGVRVSEFPEPGTLQAIADALEVDVTSVVLGVAVTIGLPVRRRGSELAAMLPASASNLTVEQRDAVLAVVRAMTPKESNATQEQESEQDQGSAEAGPAAAARGGRGTPMTPDEQERAAMVAAAALAGDPGHSLSSTVNLDDMRTGEAGLGA